MSEVMQRLLPKYGPKLADHPSIGQECPECGVPFAEGDVTSAIVLGPAGPEDAERAAADLDYNEIALEVHYSCAIAGYGGG